MTVEQRNMIKELVISYQALGLLDSPEQTATEMIAAVEEKIRAKSKKLFGVTGDRQEIIDTLKNIEKERVEIAAERHKVLLEIEQYADSVKATVLGRI